MDEWSNRPLVTDFTFPIDNPDTLEDLEYAVHHDAKTRQKYISFLRRVKPSSKSLLINDIFRHICTDSAIFSHFCFTTAKIGSTGVPRRALKDFAVFGSCMLEAWFDHNDIDEQTLSPIIKRLIKRIHCRNYVRLGRSQKMKLERSLKHRSLAAMEALRAAKEALKAKNRKSAKVHSRGSSNGIPVIAKTRTKVDVGKFVFPIMTPDEVERLEASVRQDAKLWNQYVNYLRATMEKYKDLVEVLRRTFGDEVFISYSYAGTASFSKKPSLRKHIIFSDCMLEAWPEMTRVSLTDDLTSAIAKIKDSVLQRRMGAQKKPSTSRASTSGSSTSGNSPGNHRSSDFEYDWLDNFPIHRDVIMEQLNAYVGSDRRGRKQYVNFLRAKRAECNNDLEKVLKYTFEEDVFRNYTYTAGNTRKSNLLDYPLFNSCMLASTSGSSTSEDSLRNRRSSEFEYDWLHFPVHRDIAMEQLNAYVEEDSDGRKQYVNFLRAKRAECNNDLEKVLKYAFADDVFRDYTYTAARTRKANLIDYALFNSCMLDAWPDMTSDSLYRQLSVLIPRISNRAKARYARAQEKKKLMRIYANMNRQHLILSTEILQQHNRLVSAAAAVSQQKTRIRSYTRLSALSSNRSTGVEGFTFPLQTADEIEQLEAAVRENQRIWYQYVDFLRDKKTEIMDIPSVMKLLFLDEALDGYNFNGIQGRRLQKRPLKMYAIFVDCMLDAWPEYSMQMLSKMLDDALRKTRLRHAKRIYRAKKALEEEQQIFEPRTIYLGPPQPPAQ